MVLEDGDVFDDHHVDLREDLRGKRDEDRWDLVYNVLIKAELVKVGLEKKKQKDHKGHK